MKIKVLHTSVSIASLNYSYSFSVDKYKIEYVENPEGYVIDGRVFIPIHIVKELVVESEELQPQLSDLVELLDSLPEPKKPKKNK